MPVVAQDMFPGSTGSTLGADCPAARAAAITPSNTDELILVTRGIYIGGAGDLDVTLLSGERVTFKGLVASVILPIRVKQIWTTATTATFILALS